MKRTSKLMSSFKLSSQARGSLLRVSKKNGWTKTLTVEKALVNLEREGGAR